MPKAAASVVVVCHNEEKRIVACLESILAQDFAEPWELIVIDNLSGDATAALVVEMAMANPRLRLVRNGEKTLSSGRNLGWREAAADLVAYTDADCIVPRHWLRVLVEAYRSRKSTDPALAGVGGGNRQPDDTPFYQALNLFLRSRFGNRGSTQTERFAEGRYVDSLASLNVLYERSALAAVEGYDGRRFPRVGEDEDLNCRLAESGRRIFFVSGCEVLHYWRDTFSGWCRNMYLYGFGRVKLRRRHPGRARASDLLSLAVPGAALMALFSWAAWPLAIPLIVYLAIMAGAALAGAVGAGRPSLAPRVFALFLGTHFCYGMGFARGMIADTP